MASASQDTGETSMSSDSLTDRVIGFAAERAWCDREEELRKGLSIIAELDRQIAASPRGVGGQAMTGTFPPTPAKSSVTMYRRRDMPHTKAAERDEAPKD